MRRIPFRLLVASAVIGVLLGAADSRSASGPGKLAPRPVPVGAGASVLEWTPEPMPPRLDPVRDLATMTALPGIRAFAAAGDVNGDGFSDVLVATPSNNEVAIYGGDSLGVLNFQALLGSGQLGSEFGAAVSAAGDVNGDGYDDVIVGEPLWRSPSQDTVGRVSVFHGSASGVSTTPAFQIEGTVPGGKFGAAVSRAGNLNHDAYDDVAVAAPEASVPASPVESGVAYVFHGSAGGVLPTPVILAGKHAGERRGQALAGIGDVDGDGDDDLVVGGPYRPGDNAVGRLYLYRGAPGGPSTEPGDSLSGGDPGALFGSSVAPAGDSNGDGYADVVAGAPLADLAPGILVDSGAAYLLVGSGAGLAQAVAHQGSQAGARLGESVGCAGDMNGDGLGDYVLGEPGFDGPFGADEGRVTVVYGRRPANNLPLPDAIIASQSAGSQVGFLVSGLGDLGADGFTELGFGELFGSDAGLNVRRGGIALAARTSSVSNGAGNHAGGAGPLRMGAAVSTGGDFNGDGHDDVLVGGPRDDATVPNEGVAYWLLGVAGSIELASGSGTLAGGQTGSEFGASVAVAGDVNGDGYDDALVGAPNFLAALFAEGRASLFLGQPSGVSTTATWSSTGSAWGQHWGSAVSAAGDMNRDGYADIAVGSYHDATNGALAGRVAIYLGGPGGPAASPAFELFGNSAGDSLGFAIAAAGDVNGDLFDDVVIGAPGDSLATGCAYVVYGGALPPFTAHRFAKGFPSGAGFGRALAGRGDVNGDGYADVAVGAPRATFSLSGTGSVAVFRGGPAGLPGAASQGLGGELPFDFFGSAVSWGDVSADGRSDLVVGAPGADSTAANQGAVYVFVAGSDGTLAAPAASKLITSQNTRLERGASVAANGDFNGDGFADIVFGLPGSFGGSGLVSYAAGGGVILGRERLERMRKPDDTAPIALQGAAAEVNLRLLARSAAGRQPVSIQHQAGATATSFGSLPVLGTPYLLPGLPDPLAGSTIDATKLISFPAGTSVHWRMRVKTRFPWIPYTPWLTPSGNAATLTDLLSPGGPVAVHPAPVAAPGGYLALEAPRPNPTRSGVTIAFTLPRASAISVSIHDAAGRLVRELARGGHPAGTARFGWDGADARGQGAPSGMYFVRVTTPDAEATRRFVRLR